MLDRAFQRLPGEVQPVERRVPALQLRQQAERLRVVVEAVIGRHAVFQHILARMAEGRVAEIVRKRHAFGEVFIEPERARDRARDLRDLKTVGEARPVVVALVIDEVLCLVLQAPERDRMDDAVAVALEGGARRAFRLGVKSPAARLGMGGVRGERGGKGERRRHALGHISRRP